jgi:hypothetical protein
MMEKSQLMKEQGVCSEHRRRAKMKEIPRPHRVPGADTRDRESRIRAVVGPWYRRARCLWYRRHHILVYRHGLVRGGLRGMKGLPLLGSLRMLSLGFLPDRQRTYGLGQWPSKRLVKLYLTDWQRELMFYTSWARLSYRPLLNDKVRFAELVSGFAATPKLLAVIQAGRLFPTSADVPSPDADGLFAAARTHNGLVFKPRDSSLGIGIFLLLPSDGQFWLDRKLVQPAVLDERIRCLTASYIVTPKARQAQYAAALFGKTTNTIRVLTMVDPANGEAFVAMAGHKIGTEASFPVDNAGRGGLYSIMDLESGRLTAAVSKRGVRHEKHPDTGAQIEGVTVPRWNEVLESVRRLAQRLDFIDYIGWDVVVTEDGFSVIEGNYNPDFLPLPLLANERVRAFYRHHLSFREHTPSRQDR